MTPTSDDVGPTETLPPEVEDLLARLRAAGILYRVAPESSGNGVVQVAVKGERWEIEYFAHHPMEVEVFVSNGEVEGEAALERLFETDADAFFTPSP